MSGETGQLQRLTDEQVKERLAAYNGDGSLARDIELLRDNATDLIAEEVLAQFGPERAARYAEVHGHGVDARWVQGIAEYGRQIYAEKMSVAAYIAARTATAARIMAKMVERFAADSDKLAACSSAFLRVSTIETDIILSQVALLESADAADQRGRENDDFERRVSDLVRASTEQSKSLSERTRSTAASAR